MAALGLPRRSSVPPPSSGSRCGTSARPRRWRCSRGSSRAGRCAPGEGEAEGGAHLGTHDLILGVELDVEVLAETCPCKGGEVAIVRGSRARAREEAAGCRAAGLQCC
eukprot:scaffold126854_cov57-Phaeocystis_antarctica.AAC.1